MHKMGRVEDYSDQDGDRRLSILLTTPFTLRRSPSRIWAVASRALAMVASGYIGGLRTSLAMHDHA